MSFAQERPGTNAIVALVLGIVTFVGLGPLASIPAWILGKMELRAIDEGRSSQSGRTMATIGMWLGIIGTVLTILGVLAVMLMFGGMLAIVTPR